jgi:hypothetical protein
VLSIDRAKELLTYDPDSGLFTWRVSRRGPARAGETAGSNCHGYVLLKLDGEAVFAHRLAWLVVYGTWPTNDIDHINGRRDDNRIANLRDVSRAVNLQNRRSAHRRSLSGLLGVKKNHGGWSASITTAGRRKHLGTFKTADEAHSIYLAAKRQLHEGNTL